MNRSGRAFFLLLLPALTVSGCSPFGRKTEPKELFATDSLSRRIASSIVPEPMVLNWRLDGGENAYFSTVVAGTDSRLLAGDLGQHAVRQFTEEGKELGRLEGFSYPYLTGAEDETMGVYDAGTNRLVSLLDPNFGFDLPPVAPASSRLVRQVAIMKGVAYLKDARPPRADVFRLEPSDAAVRIARLPGPTWYHLGVLRRWRDRLISASSFRPTLYTVDPNGRIDSLLLQGFDSPMLARSRAYALGEVEEPPLMIAGLYGTDEALYVINLRPGVLRIDVFDAEARLRRVLQREEPAPSGFTAVDLIVRERADSTYAFVASVNTVYGSLSLQYTSRLERFAFPSRD